MKTKINNFVLLIFFCVMAITTVHTSLKSNLFEVLPDLLTIPWFNATLIDFYLNQLMLFGILFHLEKYKLARSVPWLVAMICLGSMATSIYLLYYLNFKKESSK